MKKKLTHAFIWLFAISVNSQNQLVIPPQLTGTVFNLDVQAGYTNFYGNPTPTYGINGALLSPTIVVNKGDIVTLNVINNLTVNTTMHWHGLHVAPENDGGPHQNIPAGTTWSPNFEILNNAGTFWYHPHGHGKTDLHVSRGLAGMFIIHDPIELNLGLPQRYGIDDIPLIVQTKSFDVLQQITIADHMDTAVFVNGTLHPFTDLPAQVVRFRLLNGSSMRSFYFGFSNDMTFYQIATDGGLMQNSLPITRLLLSPGERAEILVDLSTMLDQDIDLISFASEMPIGVFGSPEVGIQPDVIDMYDENFLNGNDFKLLDIHVVSPTVDPVTVIPATLTNYVPYDESDAVVNRIIVFDTLSVLTGETPSLAEGPFGFNRATFHMDSINEIVKLGDTETWTLINRTHIAHPFHIHDIQFNILEKSGMPPAPSEQGWKDVVLVMPHDSVKFITQFTTFSDPMTPYMYHCHLLHHEDDGMMGSFLVLDPSADLSELSPNDEASSLIFPNPAAEKFWIKTSGVNLVEIFDTKGSKVLAKKTTSDNPVDISSLDSGVYLVAITGTHSKSFAKLLKQ